MIEAYSDVILLAPYFSLVIPSKKVKKDHFGVPTDSPLDCEDPHLGEIETGGFRKVGAQKSCARKGERGH